MFFAVAVNEETGDWFDDPIAADDLVSLKEIIALEWATLPEGIEIEVYDAKLVETIPAKFSSNTA